MPLTTSRLSEQKRSEHGSTLRNLGLTLHVTFSVGWLGAVACFLVLAIAGFTIDARTSAATATAMALTTWFAVVPLGIGCLITGLIQSLATPWGLLRHYWVLLKLASTLIALLVLALHLAPISELATSTGSKEDRYRLTAAAAAAIALFVFMTALSIYKPKGRTPFAR